MHGALQTMRRMASACDDRRRIDWTETGIRFRSQSSIGHCAKIVLVEEVY